MRPNAAYSLTPINVYSTVFCNVIFWWCFYLNSPVDELTSIRSQPRDVHDNVRKVARCPRWSNRTSAVQQDTGSVSYKKHIKTASWRRHMPNHHSLLARLRDVNTNKPRQFDTKSTQVQAPARVFSSHAEWLLSEIKKKNTNKRGRGGLSYISFFPFWVKTSVNVIYVEYTVNCKGMWTGSKSKCQNKN